MASTNKLGIIQTRGLGDIMIALPIALHYHEQGNHIHWPVQENWVDQLNRHVPWVKWIPIKPDSGAFFYDTPMERLRNFRCDEVICLYQALTGHPEFSNAPWFQHTGFDQYKYIRAGVAFKDKLRLAQCITRDLEREQEFFERFAPQDGRGYVITHLESSQQTVAIDPGLIPPDLARVDITNEGTVFDWLQLIERSDAVIMTDSVFANLVDGWDFQGPERYFIPQHHIQLTPTFLGAWTWLENSQINPRSRIFSAGQ
jgi:hypothetical protein